MENQKQKCSLKAHAEIDAIFYCQKCDTYMCNKCEKHHSSIFPRHKLLDLDKDDSQINSGFCKVENHHQNELDFYCKDHNALCCGFCVIKIKKKWYGTHADCDTCNIEDITEEKKNNLKSNIKTLEELSNTIKSSIDDLKILFEKISKSKEDIKLNIQKIFTKLRTALNDREDELLNEVDKQFENNYFNEDILKECDKLPNKIKVSLEKGKIIEKDWDNNKLNVIINDCIDIENNIKNINNINDKIKKSKSNNVELKFISEGEILLLESIKKFGLITTGISKNVQNNINTEILEFNPQNIKCIKKIGGSFGCANTYVIDAICFFISKNKEYVLAYIDNNYKSIIYHDINNDKEIKRINNAHENNNMTSIKYYDYHLYDIILSSAVNNSVKLWNYNESLNILTINNSNLYSSSLLFDNNSFYIFIVAANKSDYIKVYNSTGDFYKNLGNNDEYRFYIETDEINDNKYIISGGNKGVNIFNYPSFSNYYCFKEGNDSSCHNYAKIIKINNAFNIIDSGDSNIIRIWDFKNKNLIKRITSDSSSYLYGFILINNLYLIIGSDDKEIKVFDINNGILVTKFSKHTSNVIGVKLIKDKDNNTYFVSSSGDNNMYLWSLK